MSHNILSCVHAVAQLEKIHSDRTLMLIVNSYIMMTKSSETLFITSLNLEHFKLYESIRPG